MYHDICLQNLPVVFCLDRAGIVPDGPTHHGVYDLAFWRTLPNLAVLQPADAVDFEAMLAAARARQAPVIIRYPRSVATALPVADRQPLAWGKAEVVREGADLAIWGVGREAATALSVATELAEKGIQATVVNARFAMPYDRDLLAAQLDRGLPVAVIEDHCATSGLGAMMREDLATRPGSERLLALGWPQEILTWGTVAGLRARYQMDVPALTARLAAHCQSIAPAPEGKRQEPLPGA